MHNQRTEHNIILNVKYLISNNYYVLENINNPSNEQKFSKKILKMIFWRSKKYFHLEIFFVPAEK